MPVEYDGVLIDVGYRLDLLVNEEVVVELKSVAEIAPIHQAPNPLIFEAREKTCGSADQL